jgi:hypothetical protein
MRRLRLWLLILFGTIVGCSSSNTHPVRGRVLLDEKPVAGAAVTFMPVNGNGRPPTGMTDQDGVFQLTSFKKNDGALSGDYIVVVSRTDAVPPPPEAEPGDSKSVIEHYKGLKAKRSKSPPLPSVYADAAKSPLRVTVPTEGEVVLRLESKSQ